MIMSIDPIALAQALINCPSITPATGEVFDVLEAALKPLGFEVHRWVMGEPPDGPTENLVAIRGSGSPHFGFAGHLDVVPPGEGWTGDPFDARIEDSLLIGRGANDTKSPIPPLARVIAALDEVHLDDGTDAFPPSNLEFTGIETPTHASNVIPGSATAQLNIRFNNLHKGAELVRMVEEIAEREAPGA